MANLLGTLPELQTAYEGLRTFAASRGITIGVADFGGLRSQADTTRILQYRQDDYAAAVRAGQISATMPINTFRPIAPFGHSYHNYGAAFDVLVTARPATMTTSQALALLGAYAPSLGLKWGGTFSKDQDPYHFELAMSLDEARLRYANAIGVTTAIDPALQDGAPSGEASMTAVAALAVMAVIAAVWYVVRVRS